MHMHTNIHTIAHVHICVESRGQPQMSFSDCAPSLVFEMSPFTEPETYLLTGLGGLASGIHLSPSLSCPSAEVPSFLCIMESEDLNSAPHVCSPGTLLIEPLPQPFLTSLKGCRAPPTASPVSVVTHAGSHGHILGKKTGQQISLTRSSQGQRAEWQ